MGREALVHASRDELIDRVLATQARLDEVEAQLRWFKQQLFGAKSERRVLVEPSQQLALGEALVQRAEPPAAGTPVRAHVRRPQPPKDEAEDAGLRFDDSVPVQRVVVDDPALEGLVEGVDYTVVAEKKSYRLAQQPASYAVLEIVRPVVKRAATGALSAPAALPSVLPGSYADVSLLAGILVDKFRYHLPLYRQHQRLAAAGITVSRAALTGWVHRTGELLEPIYEAQLASILQGQVIAMDETPIRAGRKKGSAKGKPGKMKTGYFWPLYGERGEVAFPFAPTRAHAQVEALLGEFRGTLVSDGYEAYERFRAKHAEVVHALCWAHARRQFVKAEEVERARAARALAQIRALYEVENEIAERALVGEAKRAMRVEHSKPLVAGFFAWLRHELMEHAFLPSNPFTKAAHYALSRQAGLEVFLTDPDVPIDTNHLERALRPIPMGRKNWLFCWTELGAERVGQIQSLITTCALHGVDPYTYLVDVLQRIDTHPFSAVEQLIPRLWKQHFAAAPLRSLLDTT